MPRRPEAATLAELKAVVGDGGWLESPQDIAAFTMDFRRLYQGATPLVLLPREVSEVAVLNANYLLARLQQAGVAEYLPLAYGELCMHEFVLSGGPMKRDLGLKTLDLAKRLLDFGYHPPTVYFPLLVDEALMIEPTETETRETLDGFADAIAAILKEAAGDPEIARNAPYTTPVRRLDEVAAAKRPVIRQALD